MGVAWTSLDGKANDGPDGEKDNYLPDIETVIGATEGGNVMVGSKKANTLVGGVFGDRIDGKGGRDILVGGDGDDTITSRDGIRDAVRCGPDKDKVVADRVDKLVGCEVVGYR